MKASSDLNTADIKKESPFPMSTSIYVPNCFVTPRAKRHDMSSLHGSLNRSLKLNEDDSYFMKRMPGVSVDLAAKGQVQLSFIPPWGGYYALHVTFAGRIASFSPILVRVKPEKLPMISSLMNSHQMAREVSFVNDSSTSGKYKTRFATITNQITSSSSNNGRSKSEVPSKHFAFYSAPPPPPPKLPPVSFSHC